MLSIFFNATTTGLVHCKGFHANVPVMWQWHGAQRTRGVYCSSVFCSDLDRL